MDAVIIANYMEEWYPHVPYCVNLKSEQSVKLVENTVFQNNNLDFTNLYSTAFMCGKVLNSYLLLNTGSILCNNPPSFRFISDMISNRAFENQLITIQVKNSVLENKTYEEAYRYLLKPSGVQVLTIAVLAFAR